MRVIALKLLFGTLWWSVQIVAAFVVEEILRFLLGPTLDNLLPLYLPQVIGVVQAGLALTI